MFILTVVHPPVGDAAFGKAVTLRPTRYLANAAKTQAVYVLRTEGDVPVDEAKRFGYDLWMVKPGTLLTHEPSGFAFRIDNDLVDEAPHPCPCCGRLVLPTDHAYAHDEGAYCLGCFTWSRTVKQCLPANSAHPHNQPEES